MFPHSTVHEKLELLHKLFPPFMHGARMISVRCHVLPSARSLSRSRSLSRGPSLSLSLSLALALTLTLSSPSPCPHPCPLPLPPPPLSRFPGRHLPRRDAVQYELTIPTY